jgi:hypothetical protein
MSRGVHVAKLGCHPLCAGAIIAKPTPKTTFTQAACKGSVEAVLLK